MLFVTFGQSYAAVQMMNNIMPDHQVYDMNKEVRITVRNIPCADLEFPDENCRKFCQEAGGNFFSLTGVQKQLKHISQNSKTGWYLSISAARTIEISEIFTTGPPPEGYSVSSLQKATLGALSVNMRLRL